MPDLPLLHQIPLNPAHNFRAQPFNIHRRIVSPSRLSLGVGRSAHIHHVNQRIRMSQIIQELVSQPPALVGSRDQTCNIQELDGYGTSPFVATAVVRPAPVRNIVSLAGAFDLKVPDSSLRVNGGEAVVCQSITEDSIRRVFMASGVVRTESYLFNEVIV